MTEIPEHLLKRARRARDEEWNPAEVQRLIGEINHAPASTTDEQLNKIIIEAMPSLIAALEYKPSDKPWGVRVNFSIFRFADEATARQFMVDNKSWTRFMLLINPDKE